MTQGSNTLHFFYGADGTPAIVELNGVSYGYVKNLQGDIIAIVNASGTKVVEYVYDAWGKLLSKTGSMASTLGTLNPFRYRGYVYDEETGLYYLRSRYYNPNWCRFVNADALAVRNLFNYCNNMPINYIDKDGFASENLFPWNSTPYDYRVIFNRKGERYERWYNEYGWPYHERHWTDHNSPLKHTNPHDHHYDNPDPSQPPINDDRRQINYPDGLPDSWEGEDEWNQKKEKYNKKDENEQDSHTAEAIIGAALITGVIWGSAKIIAAFALALPTGGASYALLLMP